MPDLTTLMTEWPEEFEKTLRSAILPSSAQNCNLKEYVDIVSGAFLELIYLPMCVRWA